MYRLMYKSRAIHQIDWGFVSELTTSSEEKNNIAGLTGILVASETHFLQVLEGGFDNINDLFMRIVRDTRHDQIQLIAFDCVESRLFGSWGMHGVGIFNFNRELVADLIQHYGEEGGSVKFPLEDWRAFALIHELRMS